MLGTLESDHPLWRFENMDIILAYNKNHKVHPDVTILENLEARDFTIDAIAFDLKSKKIMDPPWGTKGSERWNYKSCS